MTPILDRRFVRLDMHSIDSWHDSDSGSLRTVTYTVSLDGQKSLAVEGEYSRA